MACVCDVFLCIRRTCRSLIGVDFWPATVCHYSSLTAIQHPGLQSIARRPFAYIIFSILHTTILIQPNPRQAALENVPYFIGFTFGTLIAFIVRVGPKSIRLSVESSLVIFVFTAVSVSLAIKMITLEKVTLYFQRVSIALKGVGGAVVEVTSDKDLESHALIENGLKTSSSSSSLAQENKQTTRTRINSTVVKTGSSLDMKGGNKKNDGGVGNGFLRHAGSGDEEESEVLLDAREDGGGKSDLALAEAMFINLMVTTACVVSFAHGNNDVSNAIAVYNDQEIWFTGQISTDSKPLYGFWLAVVWELYLA